MSITINDVHAYGVRTAAEDCQEWTALDGFGNTGLIMQQQDSAKFKSATFCNTTDEGDDISIEISIAVFHRSTFAANVATFNNTATKALFLIYKLNIPGGTTFELDETYIDKFVSYDGTTSTSGDEPVVAVWLDDCENKNLDVIIRR